MVALAINAQTGNVLGFVFQNVYCQTYVIALSVMAHLLSLSFLMVTFSNGRLSSVPILHV
jgi:hypothetical protein